MPAYFASDVHLRLDYPERGRRFARWVRSLEPSDSLTIVGDLCDFWLVSRQLLKAATTCEGLNSLRDFRARGGELTILPGNHDHWLGQFYQETLHARYIEEPLQLEVGGLRLFVAHGHRLGRSRIWKEWMEGSTFLSAFRRCPSPVASALDHLLDRFNERKQGADNNRQLALYRSFATSQTDADLVIFGHVHQTVDESISDTRLIVLGGWHRRASYLKVDASGASHVIETDSASIPC